MDDTASIKRDIKVLNDNQIELIVSLYDTPKTTWDILYLIRQVEQTGGYTAPQRVIRDALRDRLLLVDSIEPDNTIMISLAEWGEHVWKELYE